MKKTRYTGEQIAFALKQAETGTRVGEFCRKLFLQPACPVTAQGVTCCSHHRGQTAGPR
ncbi:hypothetical protein SAMN05216516_11077 [Izhakiella capsodis]|uniref:Transposase n=1 Tax=Izhakiella capsodis TaxID=1367852 RepID=A0A1I4ZZW7_9GAMM|nr:hypothetical protein SAMN05216516_11077 [Izhakiella capsodis]